MVDRQNCNHLAPQAESASKSNRFEAIRHFLGRFNEFSREIYSFRLRHESKNISLAMHYHPFAWETTIKAIQAVNKRDLQTFFSAASFLCPQKLIIAKLLT